MSARGTSCIANIEPGRAIDCYGRAIALKPDFADARFNLALLHNERREHRAALTALAPGAHAPCTPREHALTASLHLRLSEWEAAAPHLEAQLAHDPADAPASDAPAAPVTITWRAAACTPFGIAAGTGAPEKVLLTLTAANSNGVVLETSQCLANVSASAPPPVSAPPP